MAHHDNIKVDQKRLKRACLVVAEVIKNEQKAHRNPEQYIPLFLRLKAELETYQSNMTLVDSFLQEHGNG